MNVRKKKEMNDQLDYLDLRSKFSAEYDTTNPVTKFTAAATANRTISSTAGKNFK